MVFDIDEITKDALNQGGLRLRWVAACLVFGHAKPMISYIDEYIRNRIRACMDLHAEMYSD